MSKEGKYFYEFGPFRVDTKERLLLRGEAPVALPPKAFDTLLILVNQSERVALKDVLMKTLWPDSFVEETNLSQNIFVLRKGAGGDGSGRPLHGVLGLAPPCDDADGGQQWKRAKNHR